MRRWLVILLATVLLLAAVGPASAQGRGLSVYYAGPEGRVRTALTLADAFTLVEQPNQAQVLVLNGVAPAAEELAELVQAGVGLVVFLGPASTPDPLEILMGGGLPVGMSMEAQPLSLVVAPGVTGGLMDQVVWTSSPQVRERWVLQGGDVRPLVVGFEDERLVLGERRVGLGTVYLFTAFLDQANPQFQEWAYFNYLIYNLVMRAGGQEPLDFGDYPASPVPHAGERYLLFSGLALMLVIASLAFYLVRRYSRAHPELLDELVTGRSQFQERVAGTAWDEIGFHRPLGGFLFALMMGLVLFVPLIIYQNLILPVYILPSAQALGIWGRVVQVFALAWQLFDLGTSAAFIKFFSQHRVLEPRRAIQYGQVFVWWQALSGAFQVALVTAVAGVMLPNTVYALYAWTVILHAIIQIPGFYQVMRHLLIALQRFDYPQILELALYLVFPMITQPILVTLMVAWGRNHPAFGMAMGGLLGMGLAAYATEVLTFVIGYGMVRRLGVNGRLLFFAHFDWKVVKESFRFGVFEMGGSIAWAAGQALEVVITQTRLVNYAEVWGNWGLAQNFVFAYNVLQTLYNNLMPSISEAISHARKALSQYYAVMAYKYGGMISAFVGSVLLAVADRFIQGASGPEFVRAARYVIPLAIWGAVQYPSWVGDNVQLASNRPYLKFVLVGGEQVIRVVLAFLLVARLQINALILAYFVGLLSKGLVAYYVNHRLCYRQRFFAWQSVIAPLLAGAAHYGWLRWFTGLIWRQDQITSVLIFLVGILLSYPIYIFLYGLAGGWDRDTLAELDSATALTGFARPLARVFYASTALGARLSPLHNRFPVTIREAALAEARSLTQERVSLTDLAV
jgi:O-antigen/teichoic acid export membrane protein